MAVRWNAQQRSSVGKALARYPLQSNRCTDAAHAILVAMRNEDGRDIRVVHVTHRDEVDVGPSIAQALEGQVGATVTPEL